MPDALRQTLLNKLRANLDEPKSRLDVPNLENINIDEDQSIMVPHPPQWQPYPVVMGSKNLANTVDQVLSFAPALQGRIKHVQYGPNLDVLNEIANDQEKDPTQHFLGHEFGDTNLLGLTGVRSKNIALNPTLSDQESLQQLLNALNAKLPDTITVQKDAPPYSPLGVFAHEATHAAGNYGEKLPLETEELIRRLKGNLQ
jgi:hypothetical protein